MSTDVTHHPDQRDEPAREDWVERLTEDGECACMHYILAGDLYDDPFIPAIEAGIITRKGNKLHLPDCSEISCSQPDSANKQEEDETEEKASIVEVDAEGDEYTRALEDIVAKQATTIEHLEDRINSLEKEWQKDHNDWKTMLLGLTELQANRLQAGKEVGAEGVHDIEMIHDFGVETMRVGENRDVIRAADASAFTDDAAHDGVSSLPDFDKLVTIEADRQKIRHEVKKPSDISDIQYRRAIAVWDQFTGYANTESTKYVFPRTKMTELLQDMGMKKDSAKATSGLVMNALAEHCDVVEYDTESRPQRLVGEKEAVDDVRMKKAEVREDPLGRTISLEVMG